MVNVYFLENKHVIFLKLINAQKYIRNDRKKSSGENLIDKMVISKLIRNKHQTHIKRSKTTYRLFVLCMQPLGCILDIKINRNVYIYVPRKLLEKSFVKGEPIISTI